MIAWLLRTMGVHDDVVQHLDEVTLAVHHNMVLVAGLILVPVAGYFVFRRQKRNLANVSSGLRLALTATRVAILALLVIVLADPYLKIDHQSETKPIVALLFDHSRSMELPLGEFESEAELIRNAQAAGQPASEGKLEAEVREALRQVSRARHAHNVVKHGARSILEPLARKYEIRFYSFARDLVARPELPEPIQDRAAAATHLGDALARVLDDAAGRQVAGLVVFSDGENTGGRSPVDVARAAGVAGTPIFTVPCGSSKRLRDIAVVDVFTSGLVAVGDTVRVAATIESQGFDREPIQVELKDGDKILDSKPLILRGSEQQQIELTFSAAKSGTHYLTVSVQPHRDEPQYLHANNSDIALVRISEEKLRVLYVEGLPRWDFRFLKNAMRRDHGLSGRTAKEPDIVLEAELRRLPPGDQARALPRTLKELAEYHTVILGDVSPKVLTPDFVGLLAEAVREKGLGLIVAAGPRSMPHVYNQRFLDLLPVWMSPRKPGLQPAPGKPFQLELSPEGAVHEAMRFHDDPGRNRDTWSHFPPYHWCAATERPAPAAAVLVWNPSVRNNYGKLPLVASHYAGHGKVMFVGTDSTFLWRQNVGDRFFYKFWGQSIRFVARRDQTGIKKSWLEVRPVRVQPAEDAQIELRAFAADGTPRGDPALPVRVAGKDTTADTVSLTADPNVKGRYTGKCTPQIPGEYRVSFDPGEGNPAVEAKFRVMPATEELRHPNVNRPALALIAGASGGQMIELPDLATLPDQLKGEAKLVPFHREATLWDNWLTLVVLAVIYSLDVGLRRLAGLS